MIDLTTEQKAALTSGADFWSTTAVPDAAIASVLMTDGPHGVRLQDGSADGPGLGGSVAATCFPPAVGLAASWDVELVERVGVALGLEARSYGVGVLLGPGINLKRSPLCGRNFEYFSEDPLLTGVMGAAWVRGLQSTGVGASLKHFAVNNQETDRMRVSADVDDRTLRELYLRAFQRIVTQEQPWTVMCSYNRINGVPASQDPWLLTEVLREEWGFAGVVVSDWGAVVDRVAALDAGLDLEMPSSGGRGSAEVIAAVNAGMLDAGVLDASVTRLRALASRTQAAKGHGRDVDWDAHHALAREAAGRGVVLLANDGILPLDAGVRVAVIGELARTPRYQGAGSSLVNPTRLENAVEEMTALARDGVVTFAPGYDLSGEGDAALVAEAVEVAGRAEVAVVFLGLPPAAESEGFDREHLMLPTDQLALLDAVVAVQSQVVVVLANGGVVEVSSWEHHASALVEGWLSGQAGGGGVADVLYGVVNPSGRLAETVPVRLEDTAAFLDFPGEGRHVRYGEGLHVGYRWHDARRIEPAYPFGHGLSYTTYEYSDLVVETGPGGGGLHVRLRVTNTGHCDGREVVQVYVAVPGSQVRRAPQELKGFVVVPVGVGESADVLIAVPGEDLAYWDVAGARWIVEPGTYVVSVGASSRDLRVCASVDLDGDAATDVLDEETTIAELVGLPGMRQVLAATFGGGREGGEADDDALLQLVAGLPLGRLPALLGAGAPPDLVARLLEAARDCSRRRGPGDSGTPSGNARSNG